MSRTPWKVFFVSKAVYFKIGNTAFGRASITNEAETESVSEKGSDAPPKQDQEVKLTASK